MRILDSRNLGENSSIQELLIQIILRIEDFMRVWESSQFPIAETTHIEVATTPTIIFRNTGDDTRLLEVFNTDNAQPLFMSISGMRRSYSIPVYPEKSEQVSVPAGKTLYGIVEGATIDVRYAEFTSLRAFD